MVIIIGTNKLKYDILFVGVVCLQIVCKLLFVIAIDVEYQFEVYAEQQNNNNRFIYNHSDIDQLTIKTNTTTTINNGSYNPARFLIPIKLNVNTTSVIKWLDIDKSNNITTKQQPTISTAFAAALKKANRPLLVNRKINSQKYDKTILETIDNELQKVYIDIDRNITTTKPTTNTTASYPGYILKLAASLNLTQSSDLKQLNQSYVSIC